MVEVKKISFFIKDGIEFIGKKYTTINGFSSYEYYLFFHYLGKNLFPPQSLTDEQIKMSVQDYIDKGRHEWFQYVNLSNQYKAWKLLNE